MMNGPAGNPLLGYGYRQCAAVAGYVVASTITGEQESGYTLPENIKYDVMIEMPEGLTYMEGLQSSVKYQHAPGVKVKPCQAGEPFLGARVGDTVAIYIYHEPKMTECPPEAGEPE
jgi:hypothetical protein